MTASRLRTERCLCGLLLRYHRDRRNRQRTCEEARRVHPRARVIKPTLAQSLWLARKEQAR